jgi:hypothetical protein
VNALRTSREAAARKPAQQHQYNNGELSFFSNNEAR